MKKNQIVQKYLQELNINHTITTLEDITQLIKAHLRTFAFSSLKVLLKEEISLDLNSIYENLVVKKRGGYCFEQNKLIYEVLKELGFNVTYYLARVINNTDNIPPPTHRFTLLNLNNQNYIIDVGIGFRTPSVPIKFGDNVTISHLDVEYKIIEHEDKTYSMQLIEKNKPFNATKFDLNRCYEADFEMGHFYSYKNPDAIFVNNFVISLIQDDVIHTLLNDKYLKIYKNTTKKIEIESSIKLQQILIDDFNSQFTDKECDFFYKNYIKKQ